MGREKELNKFVDCLMNQASTRNGLFNTLHVGLKTTLLSKFSS